MRHAITYREARPGEASAVSAIAFESKASNGYSTGFMEACRNELTYTPDQIQSDGYHFLVAVENDAMVGFAALEILEDLECAIEGLFIRPASKGLGAGSGLMTETMNWARARGMSGIHIQSDPGAVGFYRGIGARVVGSSPSGSIPGRMLPQLFLDLSRK